MIHELHRPGRGRVPRTVLGAVCSALLAAALLATPSAPTIRAADPPPGEFLETFTGRPPDPTPWQPTSWDVTVHSRDRETWKELQPMMAHHGPDCSAYPGFHPTSAYDDAVFLCNDHMMTAINASGYGVIYLTPNQLVDFSSGEAVVRFDASTLRSSGRDWWDLWLTPYDDNLQLPLHRWLPDLTGEPRRAVHVEMTDFNGETVFRAATMQDFGVSDLDRASYEGYEKMLTPSGVTRDTFELRISRTSLKFGMPKYGLWWIDTPMSDLGWDRAVLQIGHHSYTPTKDCDPTRCGPNTWHWDNVSISPAQPFTIIRGNQHWVDGDDAVPVEFAAPAPTDAHLRFAAIGAAIEVSYDDGATWQLAEARQVVKSPEEAFHSYWTPIPAGTTQVEVRGRDWWGGGWMARDFSIWSPVAPSDAAASPPAEPASEAAASDE
ncbi:MAG: hypothetical protein IT305_30945 [Chloroflexi bacterium]|nr:hypothetical protein [Chloroflexota bacterium]